MSNNLRAEILTTVYNGRRWGHIPSSLSVVDIIDTLYETILNIRPANVSSENRDFFVLSKGHGCSALYVVLKKFGMLTGEQLTDFNQTNGLLGALPDCTKLPGVDASTGSLGHGLPFALGIAMGQRARGLCNKTFVLVGDGECNEGTTWESALIASKFQLGNLCCIIDNNGSINDFLPVSPLAEKWRAFGWEVHQVNGHSKAEMTALFSKMQYTSVGSPKLVVADTIKGKGIKLMENDESWHTKLPQKEQYEMFLNELLSNN